MTDIGGWIRVGDLGEAWTMEGGAILQVTWSPQEHRGRDPGTLAARRESELKIHRSVYVLWNTNHL